VIAPGCGTAPTYKNLSILLEEEVCASDITSTYPRQKVTESINTLEVIVCQTLGLGTTLF